MDEAEFEALAEAALASLEGALERAGLDYEVKPGGVIEIEFDDGARIIVNRHGAARQIWLAARSGGFHFAPQAGRWIGTRDGVELFAAIARLVREHTGADVDLGGPAG